MENLPSWTKSARSSARRFSTLEGWTQIGQGIYAAAGTGYRFITVDPEFEFHNESHDASLRTRRSTIYYNHNGTYIKPSPNGAPSDAHIPRKELPSDRLNTFGSYGQANPFADPVHNNPFSDPVATVSKEQGHEVPEPLYHVFSKRQKWKTVCIIGVAGLFSGLSSNIYFPSLDSIARELHVSLGTVSFTITSYLIIQGISPLFWGAISDTLGRRPIYIYSFSVYIIANIFLSFSPNFAILLIFRGVQAAGSASTVSIGNGVIQDITPPSERGGFLSFYQAIRNFSIAIGPVLGGILSQYLGFRSIFVFLLILSAATAIVIVLLLPETMRSIAGNGMLRLTGIYKPLIWTLTKEPAGLIEPDEPIERSKVTIRTFSEPLKMLVQKEILTILLFGGVAYAIWSMVTASTTGLFKEHFRLNDLLVGLAFIPNGLGTIVGAATIGTLMNRDYARAEQQYKINQGLAADFKISKRELPTEFPIEQTRLRNMWWIVALFTVSTAAYGWTLAFPAATSMPGFIFVPLFFQFLIAATSNAIFAANQTLISDLCPGKGASSTAINNLVRCTLGAVGVAFIDSMISSLGVGPTFVTLSLIAGACTPLLVVEWYFGMPWRVQRSKKTKRFDIY